MKETIVIFCDMAFLSASMHMSVCAHVHLPVRTQAILKFYCPKVKKATFKEAVQAQNVTEIFFFEET